MLGVWSGVGLTMSDMVGAGVLTTAGFMALDLSPRLILLEWFVGGLVALSGAVAYAALVRLVPRSGGEYRYLSDLLHPVVGYIAGWASLLVGFSVPVALAALAAGAYGKTIFPSLDARFIGAGLIVTITASHTGGLRTSRWTQDALALVKGVLIAVFIAIGIVAGTNTLPQAPVIESSAGFPVEPFFTSLIFVSFCYSGWNAATYAAGEFQHPRRDVPRAMLLGCSAVIVLYLLVNWVFVTNLDTSDMTGWISGDTDRITLAHLVMRNLLGESAATFMSAVVVVALASAISAMMLVGPRVYAAMADDRFLPPIFATKSGAPPRGSVLLQGALACALVFMSEFRELLNNVGSILAVVSAAAVLSLYRRSRWTQDTRPTVWALCGAAVYAMMSAWMVYFTMKSSPKLPLLGLTVPTLALWMAAIVAAALTAFGVTRILRSRAGASTGA
ncbi:MAG: APC family permease [Nannocystaceae bacterium]|nr:APC family permease [bacterium]